MLEKVMEKEQYVEMLKGRMAAVIAKLSSKFE
jgi:hypothetical protein